MNATNDKRELGTASTLVVGLGKTGLSCVRFLRAHGVPVAVTDTRAEPPGLADLRRESPEVETVLGGFDAEQFARAERLLVSPGVPVQEPLIAAARERGADILGDVELFARLVRAPVLAITGSNGKSTVTTLVGDMVAQAGRRVLVGGNIGRPVLDMLAEPPPEFYVLELSSFQLETTASLDAAAAVVLNVTEDHMDRYTSLAEYTAAKRRVYRGHGVQVVNRDDPAVLAMAEGGRRVIRFGLDAPAAEDFGRMRDGGEFWLAKGTQRLLPVRALRIPGAHNQANALAALALGDAVGLPLAAMLKTLREFTGLPHRTQWVAEIDGVNWYNDSKGTNVGATLAAINGMSEPLVLIAGGLGKGADFSGLRAAVAAKVRAVVLIGQDAPKIAAALEGATTLVQATDMDEAVRQAQGLARRGDSVLLSPACASFDMFKGYDHRGEVFSAAVRALAGGTAS